LLRKYRSPRDRGLGRTPGVVDEKERVSLDRYRKATAGLTVSTILIAISVAMVSGVLIDSAGIALVAWLSAALLVVACMWRSNHTRIADFLGTIGLIWSAAVGCGVIAMLSLRFQLPMADGLLFSLDHTLGFDGVAIAAWLVDQGQWIFSIMAPAYALTIPLMVISMTALALGGRRVEAWRAAFSFVGSLVTICLIAISTPAKGLGVWAPPQLLKHLPDGAMRYFWANFDRFYAGTKPVLSLATIDGVISFPSLHAAMGFTTVAMWRKNWLCLAMALSWLTFMLLATFPYGGHYVVDVLAGIAVAAGWFALSRRIEAHPRSTATETAASAIQGG
jgi:hypothetical protein